LSLLLSLATCRRTGLLILQNVIGNDWRDFHVNQVILISGIVVVDFLRPTSLTGSLKFHFWLLYSVGKNINNII
ncbi:MAG: hypothetical protein OEX77_12355, partial [Candidatus Bathyarchaeota archaeon]|nr:hypothetical protein [Candidatus Bathyarchaeota archaeon]